MTPQPQTARPRSQPVRYGLAAVFCALTTIVALPLRPVLDLANIVMLFLLAVFLIAVGLGRGPAVTAAFLGVALFDFFFVPPRLSLAVADIQYLVTFAVMLAVGLIAAHLAARLAEHAEQAARREADTRRLYEVAREMAGASSLEQVAAAAGRYLDAQGLDAGIHLATAAGEVEEQGTDGHGLGAIERSFAQFALRRDEIVEVDSLAGTGVDIAFFPLRAPSRLRGVLAVRPRSDDTGPLRALRPALEAIASLIALAVERLHFAESARQAEIQVAAERLRTSVLSALSHDLRTPLTSLVGLADTLAEKGATSPDEVAETAEIIRNQAQSMHRLLTNLLDMARLQSHAVVLRREWQPFDEVVGSSLRLMRASLAARRIGVAVPPGLPLLHFDAVLIERVLCNLLDNALKYSDENDRIELSATLAGDCVEVAVCNEGRGFPPERIAAAFELFVRGDEESAIPGVGLGLAICKAIVAAHGGGIRAENRERGACVRFTLPRGDPPAIEDEE